MSVEDRMKSYMDANPNEHGFMWRPDYERADLVLRWMVADRARVNGAHIEHGRATIKEEVHDRMRLRHFEWSITITGEVPNLGVSYSAGTLAAIKYVSPLIQRQIRHDTRIDSYKRGAFGTGSMDLIAKHATVPLYAVVAALLHDASGADNTFEDWCADYGYDTDSRRAMDTYLTCQKTVVWCRKWFGPDYSNAAALVSML